MALSPFKRLDIKSGLLSALLALSVMPVGACLIDTDFLAEENIFYCEADTDCDPGFECNVNTKACVRKGAPVPQICVDMDEDGYGVGDDRRECRFPEPDTDDTDPSFYPGARDICDGKDNDQDPATADGQIPCTDVRDCIGLPTVEGGDYYCEGDGQTVCVIKARKQLGGCENLVFTCKDGMLEQLPEECL